MKRDTEEKTTAQKIKTAGRILKRRIRKKYRKYARNQTLKKSNRIRMRHKLSFRDYYTFRFKEIKDGDWKRLAVYALIFLFCIFLLTQIMNAAAGIFHGKPGSVETETQPQTETEKTYPEKDITIGSTGCMLLHSPFIDSYPDSNGKYDFSSVYKFITPYYSAPDYMTCEFEGALGGEELGYSGYPSFKSPDVIIENIRDCGVDLQFLATNHIYDGWSYGFRRTMDVYEKKGIPYTGIRKTEQDKHYYIADIKGIKVGFVNYVYETAGIGTNLNGMQLEQEDWNLVNVFDYNNPEPFYKEMEDNIRNMKEEGAQFIIAQLHWGNEYQLTEADYQREIAQKLADLGIDAIIGGHPHCEQPIDVFRSSVTGQRIFCIFSEGNALSNQRTYLMDEMPSGHTEDGAMITLTLHQNKQGDVSLKDIALLPTWVYRWEENGSKYYILPLDDVENIEKTTGISGIKKEAKASYDRTMEELMPGLNKAKKAFGAVFATEDEPSGSAQSSIGI